MTDEERRSVWASVIGKTMELAEVIALVINLPMDSADAMIVDGAFNALDDIHEVFHGCEGQRLAATGWPDPTAFYRSTPR